ncbi:tripartite tricarboxylate transporter TctB family protein [Ornithinimicrobium cerasi]|uniref:tripartite tricarboxylate transporter TctB family protein n=1 Tax=Ornithinimicrobium cerasi TaxID=2248773 RepID=UPI0013793E5C|nr:tripartite tricarboxylate transporter TctB family protein [Ornithinimicrobium cerasi]
MTSFTYSRSTVEWALAGGAATAGLAALIAGRSFGLTATTGVGSGLVPAAAGVLLLLGSGAWALELMTASRTSSEPDALEAVAQVVSSEADLAEAVHEEETEPVPGLADWARVLTVLTAMTATAALLPVLGFTVTMVSLLLVLLIGVSRRRALTAVTVAVVATLGARLVFDVWLGTVLPTSSLPVLSGWGL